MHWSIQFGAAKHSAMDKPSFSIVIAALMLAFAPAVSRIDAASAAERPRIAAKELGIRHGQAIAAVRTCPGARLTAKAEGLETDLGRGDLAVFRDESDRILTAWANAFACTDVDPAQTREINGCRRAKILSCNQAWQEIGPDGMALPGLVEFRPDGDGDGVAPPP